MKKMAETVRGSRPHGTTQRGRFVTSSTAPTVLRVGTEVDSVWARSIDESTTHSTVCGGPAGSTCPIVEGDGCSLVDDAAGIVFELDLDDAYNREILRCYRTRPGPQIPIQVVAPVDQQDRHRDLLAGTTVTSEVTDRTIGDFIDRVELAALARRALSDLVGNPRVRLKR